MHLCSDIERGLKGAAMSGLDISNRVQVQIIIAGC